MCWEAQTKPKIFAQRANLTCSQTGTRFLDRKEYFHCPPMPCHNVKEQKLRCEHVNIWATCWSLLYPWAQSHLQEPRHWEERKAPWGATKPLGVVGFVLRARSGVLEGNYFNFQGSFLFLFFFFKLTANQIEWLKSTWTAIILLINNSKPESELFMVFK